MAYIRKRGSQLAIVHGRREGETGKVEQVNLFTLYSQEEARAAFENPDADSAVQFRYLLEDSFPQIKFEWRKMREDALKNLPVLPEKYENREAALFDRLPADLAAFGRQLCLADPTDVPAAAEHLQKHQTALLGLCDLIRLQLSRLKAPLKQHFAEDRFRWAFRASAREVPIDIQHYAEELYEEGQGDEAERIFSLLVECFPGHAEGYYYLGHIALERGRYDEAVSFFQKTIETGRRLFPKRLPKGFSWKDLRSRPYVHGLHSLAFALNCVGKYPEALAICRRMEKECGSEFDAISQRARIFLNRRDWKLAAEEALKVSHSDPESSFVAAFALFEFKEKKESLAWFLHAALNYPQAARAFAGVADLAKAVPGDFEGFRDRETRFDLRRELRDYFAGRNRRARPFFRKVLRHPKVEELLGEVIRLRRPEDSENHENNGGSQRRQLIQMQMPEFARGKAEELQELAR